MAKTTVLRYVYPVTVRYSTRVRTDMQLGYKEHTYKILAWFISLTKIKLFGDFCVLLEEGINGSFI
jgi:hypothetical protein